MRQEYIVRCSALLGRPNTLRTFYAGEVVTKADFVGDAAWEKAKRTGAIERCPADERDAATALRARLDREEFGFTEASEPALLADAIATRRQELGLPAPEPEPEPEPVVTAPRAVPAAETPKPAPKGKEK